MGKQHLKRATRGRLWHCHICCLRTIRSQHLKRATLGRLGHCHICCARTKGTQPSTCQELFLSGRFSSASLGISRLTTVLSASFSLRGEVGVSETLRTRWLSASCVLRLSFSFAPHPQSKSNERLSASVVMLTLRRWFFLSEDIRVLE